MGIPVERKISRSRENGRAPSPATATCLLSLVVEYFPRFLNDNYAIFGLQMVMIGAFILPTRWHNLPMTTYDFPSSVALADGG